MVGAVIVTHGLLARELLDEAKRIVGEQKESVHFYQLAVGCASDAVVNLHESLRPAVIRILRHIVEIERRKGIPVSMCGGMAAFSDWAELTMNNPGELT